MFINTRKNTRYRYRLYANGEIFDREIGKTIAYIISRIELDIAWELTGKDLQEYLARYIS